MKAYKAFNHDMTCRDFKFEIGKTYTHEGDISLCNAGFHACEAPLDVLGYYPPTALFAEVELGGVSDEKSADTKRVGKSIAVKAGLNIAGLVSAQIEWVSKQTDANIISGDSSKAASSGNYSTAASSGDSSTAASSGNYSKAASSGNYSTAASSGDSSKAASSGNYSTAASSGDYSKAEASGKQTVAMVAGLGGRARAGINGAFALAYKDGVQIRIAVGIVGEDGILADTWYQVEGGKLVQA